MLGRLPLIVFTFFFRFFDNSYFSYAAYIRIDELVRSDEFHSVIIGVKQHNLEKIEEILHKVSDPFSSEYGHHLSREVVGELTRNSVGLRTLKNYFTTHGARIIGETLYGEYITVEATISKWESLLSTTFYHFQNTEDRNLSVRRAMDYTIHQDIRQHVSVVFNVEYLPFLGSSIHPIILSSDAADASSYVTPLLLNNYYNIFSNNGSMTTKQTIYSSISQYWSSTDLATFQSTYGIPSHPIDADPDNVNNHYKCVYDANNCAESNLDVQYITAVAQNTWSSIIYDSTNDAFVTWITSVANSANPSSVYSISYGIQESSLVSYSSYTTAFNTEAMKLGVMGTTIFVSSGDDGAPGNKARSSSFSCGYDPSFPASSPYVVAVGATMGPEAGTTEVVCDSSLGGVITSGGGFSKLFTAQSHQKRAIKGYFKSGTTAAVSGYSTTGRGLPDISLAGKYYAVVIGGVTYALSGTSASSPAVAGMFSLINAARIKQGLSTVGWVNPAIYAYNGSFTNDITSGNIKCTVSVCCSQGFYAAKGWDPTTGFGSVDFQKLYNLFVPQQSPSTTPTSNPTISFRPTSPSQLPSVNPTITPSNQPTSSPTNTRTPTAPTLFPTSDPTIPSTISPSLSPSLRLGYNVWKFATEGELWGQPVAGADGTIYFGSGDGYIYAISPDGTKKWSYKISSSVDTTVAIATDGTVYVGSNDNNLYALSSTGKLKWKYNSGSPIRSSPIIGVDDGEETIYFGNDLYYIFSISSQGNLNWKYKTDNEVRTSPVLGVNGSTIYVTCSFPYLYAISSTRGTLLWKYEVGSTFVNKPAVGMDGTVYIINSGGTVYALSSTGTLLWTYTAAAAVVSSITVDSDGTLYFGCDDYNLYALTSSGVLKWKYTTGNIVQASVAIGADGSLYFGSYDNYIYALTSTGTLQWSHLTGGATVANPLIGTNGMLYSGNKDYHLYALFIGYTATYTTPPTTYPSFAPSSPTVSPVSSSSTLSPALYHYCLLLLLPLVLFY